MKFLSTLVGSLLLSALVLVSAVSAAPVESMESGPALTAMQTVDEFLAEKAVADQLAALGLTPAEVRTRVAALSESDLARLAADIETLRAGGTIQGGNPHPWGPIGCAFKSIGRFFADVYHMVFCWDRPL